MMKKLLALFLILGLASVASATLQISVNGDKEPVDSEIILLGPSDELILDIWTDSIISAGNGEVVAWELVVAPADGSISGGVSLIPEAGVTIFDDVTGFEAEPGTNGVWGGIAMTGQVPQIDAGATIYDDILFHCNGLGDAVVKLYVGDFVTWDLVDSVVIHQPEPMTIALLGLGGLFLRRRK
jgi:hypothetical protein